VIIVNKLVFRLKVTGRSNLSAISKTGCFLISNHTLYLDPAIIAHAISPRRTLFSALQSTFKIPVSQDIDEFQNGVFFLAYLLNRPIIPIILMLYPRTLFGFRINRYFIRVKAVIGEPIYAIKNPDSWHSKREAVEEMAAYAHKVMEELIKQEQSLARNKRRHFLRL
jgi:1-acyl-sn-glycerol-3-phosphate acyltransferase